MGKFCLALKNSLAPIFGRMCTVPSVHSVTFYEAVNVKIRAIIPSVSQGIGDQCQLLEFMSTRALREQSVPQ
jgi:hypothetical protein